MAEMMRDAGDEVGQGAQMVPTEDETEAAAAEESERTEAMEPAQAEAAIADGVNESETETSCHLLVDAHICQVPRPSREGRQSCGRSSAVILEPCRHELCDSA